MLNINGKVLVFTDIHFGIKNNSISRQKICISVIKKILDYISKNQIQNIIFLGDYFHSRTQISVDVINIAYKCIQAISKKAKILMIIGNHDSFMKNSLDINSIKMFSDIKNVLIIENTTEISINNNISLLVPWLADLSKFKLKYYDMLFGHFDISTKFLIKQYIENNKNKNIPLENQNINDNNILLSSKDDQNVNIGNFIDYAKDNGIVFSGHIHNRKEFISKGRNFIFIGSPYQQNLGEINNKCGFYIINEKNEYEFKEITGIPKHVELKISDIVKDIENFDFNIVKNNIILKKYDIQIDSQTDKIISQKILDMQPFEELLPEYDIQSKNENYDDSMKNSIELLNKSKLEYIQNYINNIDEKTLKEDDIDKITLYKTLEKYYQLVI